MVRFPLALTLFSPIVFLTGVSPATADPVRFTFNIQIEYRCTLAACDPHPASFPIVMTLDDGVTRGVDNAWNHERWYGVPSFSTVPLERPAIPASASLMYTPAVDITFMHDGGWRRVAHAYSGHEFRDTDGTYYNWNISMYRVEDDVRPLPNLTPAAMAVFLGGNRGDGFFGFNFSGQLAGGGLTPNSIGYMGTAQLVDETAPVPEPATMLLIGSGLAMLYRRKARAIGRSVDR